ncbi:methanethiol S-methyltransferase [Phenylobacterium sp.]|uniref:methanethiol S-methyltransferase n=1 Tax=Phenylobacterium sp. TaxID=1871053 RepID=UPI002F403CEA
MSRILTLIYGVLSYAVFLAVFLYAIGFIGGFVTPTALDGPVTRPPAQALAINLGLLAVFAIQHSGMARPAFKRWWTRIVPVAAERSTYVLVSSLLLVGFFVLWEPIGGVVWQVPDGPRRLAVIGLYLFGWALLLYATFLIDHFDLFGLTQVWRRMTDQSYRAPKFHTPGLYRLVRHPLYVGWLIIFWAAPVMTVAHLIFAVMTTAYILIAIQFEERDLVTAFGQTYLDYRRRTPMLVPRLLPSSRDRDSLAHPVRTRPVGRP